MVVYGDENYFGLSVAVKEGYTWCILRIPVKEGCIRSVLLAFLKWDSMTYAPFKWDLRRTQPSKWDTAIVPPPDRVRHPINKLVHFSFQSLCECNEILVVSPWILSRSCSSCSVANDTFIYSVCEHTAVFCTQKSIIQITHTATHHSASSTFSTSLKNTRKLAAVLLTVFLMKTWRDARSWKTYNFIFPNRSLSTYAPVKQFLRVDKDKVIYSHPVSHRFIFSELEHSLGPEQ